ncbi:MAG: hypothetical protein IKL54_07105 [Bacteroidaceae bacterium]|nr:hypothetical protein [Bacteroidaceae bacterium]
MFLFEAFCNLSYYLTNEVLALIERLPVRQAKAFRLFIDTTAMTTLQWLCAFR